LAPLSGIIIIAGNSGNESAAFYLLAARYADLGERSFWIAHGITSVHFVGLAQGGRIAGSALVIVNAYPAQVAAPFAFGDQFGVFRDIIADRNASVGSALA
jgi:hypothetical protein